MTEVIGFSDPAAAAYARLPALFRLALQSGTEAGVLLHLRRGAPLEARDDQGRTPLLLAAARGNETVCRLLLNEGADLFATDTEGRTAHEIALRGGHTVLAALLLPTPEVASPETAADDLTWEAEDWEAEDEIPRPAGDVETIASSIAAQAALAKTHIVDTAADWSDTRLTLPDERLATEFAAPPALRRLLARALINGLISQQAVRAAADALGGGNATFQQLIVVLEAANVEVHDRSIAARAWSMRPNAGPVSREALRDCLELYASLSAPEVTPWAATEMELRRQARPGADAEATLWRSLATTRRELQRAFERAPGGQEALRLAANRPLFAAPDLSRVEDAADDGDRSEEFADEPTGEPTAIDTGLTLPLYQLERAVDALRRTNAPPAAVEDVARAFASYSRAHGRLVEMNLRLVPWTVRRYLGLGLELSDLVQEGTFGLMRAADRFDPDVGARFSTYAMIWIRQTAGRAVQDQSRVIRVPVHLQDFWRKVQTERRTLRLATGLEPKPEEVAVRLDATIDRVRRAWDPPGDAIPLPRNAAAKLADPSPSPFDVAAAADAGRIIGRTLLDLDARQERVLRLRFGFHRDREFTLEEVGASFSVTRERIRQIELKALMRLGHPSRIREFRHLFERSATSSPTSSDAGAEDDA